MSIDKWRVVQIQTPGYPPHNFEPVPASMLTHEAQWVNSIDSDTGEKTSFFVGPVFPGTEISLKFEADDGADPIQVTAMFNGFRPSPVSAREPSSELARCGPCPPEGTYERFMVGCIVEASGSITIAPMEPLQSEIWVYISSFEKGNVDDANL